MNDATTLYDNLTAIYRVFDVLPENISEDTRRDLDETLCRTGNELANELRALPIEERLDLMYDLQYGYGNNPYAYEFFGRRSEDLRNL